MGAILKRTRTMQQILHQMKDQSDVVENIIQFNSNRIRMINNKKPFNFLHLHMMRVLQF